MVKNYFILILFIIYSTNIISQTNTLDDIQTIDNFRYDQIFGDSNIKRSFLIRSTFDLQNIKFSKLEKIKFNLIYNNINNNNLPIANNLGSIFPARGSQNRLSFGAKLYFKNIEINYQPEFVNAENKEQIPFNGNLEDGNWWARYYLMVANNINDYRQFDEKKINKTFFGQSRIGFNNGKIAFGISNENIWWGPGKRNSLIFTNNANGFQHYYFRSSKPINTRFGLIEFHIIKGDIDSTIYKNKDNMIMQNIWQDGIIKKYDNGRNVYAFNLVWNPFFAKNIFIGYSVANQFYKNLQNSNSIKYNFYSRDKPMMLLKSLQFRYMLPKDYTEFYFEIGNQNNSSIFSDTSNLGFIIGASKYFKFTKDINYEILIECTQLSLMNPKMIFNNGDPFGQPKINSWYTSNKIRQGWTNQGKILGASIGPGSNSQLIGFNIYKKRNKFGVFAERTIYNTDFYHYVYLGKLGYSTADAYYVDLSWGININIKCNSNISIASSFISTQSLNYRWVKNGNWQAYAEPGFNSDRSNNQFILSLRYNINEFN